MKLVVLISCMHQEDTSIIERSNVQTDAVVVNQCDKDEILDFDYINKKGDKCHVRFINTTERGLSKSRNMAISNAWGDIILLCDDDEVFTDDYESSVIHQFETHPSFSIIAFKLIYERKKFGDKEQVFNRFTATSLSSAQLAFKRNEILKTDVVFDTMLGSGSGNGGGEENKYMFQLLGKGLKVIYVPVLIAEIKSNGPSLWFEGYTDQYIINEGWCYRRIFGTVYSYPLLWYHALKHVRTYNRSFLNNLYLLHKGYFEQRHCNRYKQND